MIFNNTIFNTKTYFSCSSIKKPLFMKSVLLACFLIVNYGIFAQDSMCNLWLGDTSDSTNNIKQFAEKYLELQTKLLPSETSTIAEMRDDNHLAQIKIWLKPKKMLVSGAMTTGYVISSFKIVSLSDKIDALYAALTGKVQACLTQTSALNTMFGNNKMFIERNSGGFGDQGLPMSTLTVTSQ